MFLFVLTYFPLQSSFSNNIFENLPSLAPTLSNIGNELDHYLTADTEDVQDGLLWWPQETFYLPSLVVHGLRLPLNSR